jgi:voltage-gated sodium channel
MLTLFSLVIVENWIDIFNINFYGCNINGYENSPIPCDHPNPQPILATLYFISFTIIGAMIILNLFIGVITNEIQETKKEIEKNNLKNINKPLEKKILSIQEKIQELSNEIKSLEESIKDDLGKKF